MRNWLFKPRLLGPEDCPPRTGEEAGLYEKLQRIGLDNRGAVEALDRKALRSTRSDVRH